MLYSADTKLCHIWCIHYMFICSTLQTLYAHIIHGAGSICLRYWLDIFICYTVQVVYVMTQYTRHAPSLSSTPVPHPRFSSPVNRIQMHYALITYCRSAVDPMINIDYVPSLLVYKICTYHKLVQCKFAVLPFIYKILINRIFLRTSYNLVLLLIAQNNIQ